MPQQQQQQATQVKVDTSFNVDYFSEISWKALEKREQLLELHKMKFKR